MWSSNIAVMPAADVAACPGDRRGAVGGISYRRDEAAAVGAIASGSQQSDWTRNESVAGLWTYAQTYGQQVSRLPGSPVAETALALGRAAAECTTK